MISTAIGDHFPRVRPIVNDYALGFPRVFFFFTERVKERPRERLLLARRAIERLTVTETMKLPFRQQLYECNPAMEKWQNTITENEVPAAYLPAGALCPAPYGRTTQESSLRLDAQLCYSLLCVTVNKSFTFCGFKSPHWFFGLFFYLKSQQKCTICLHFTKYFSGVADLELTV